MKVGHKTRRGRKRNPVPHGPHRTKRGVITDPVSRARAVAARRKRAALAEPDDEGWAA